MSNLYNLVAEKRELLGTVNTRALRRDKKIPAIVYGGKKNPISITIHENEVARRFEQSGSFWSQLYVLSLNGKEHKVVIKEVQFHPVTDKIIHIDFIHATKRVEVIVPIRFINKNQCVSIKRGAVLNVPIRHLRIECPVDNILEYAFIDLTTVNAGDCIRVKDITLDKKYKIHANPDQLIAVLIGKKTGRSNQEDNATDSAENAGAS